MATQPVIERRKHDPEVERRAQNGLNKPAAEGVLRSLGLGLITAITVFTFLAMGLNFFGINPMKALVWAGIVQGFSTPFLMLLVMVTSDCSLPQPSLWRAPWC